MLRSAPAWRCGWVAGVTELPGAVEGARGRESLSSRRAGIRSRARSSEEAQDKDPPDAWVALHSAGGMQSRHGVGGGCRQISLLDVRVAPAQQGIDDERVLYVDEHANRRIDT